MFRRSGVAPELDALPHPIVVKSKIPRSAFTKTGPGVRAELRRALLRMTVEQRLVAKNRGWDKGLVEDDGRVRNL